MKIFEIIIENRNNIIHFIESNVILRQFTTERERKGGINQAKNTYIPVLKHLSQVHKISKTMHGYNALKFRHLRYSILFIV